MNQDNFWNLGIELISGSPTAEKIVGIVKEKLLEYGICLKKDVIACVSDGASVMKKAARLMGVEHHICYAHGIHLTIVNSIYKKKGEIKNEENLIEPIKIIYSNQNNECESNESIFNMEDLNNDSNEEVKHINDVEIASLIIKIRRIVKIFRKSSVKNDHLQKYVIEKHEKRLNLILDTVIRWNTLVYMIERFLILKDEIKKTLIDLKIEI